MGISANTRRFMNQLPSPTYNYERKQEENTADKVSTDAIATESQTSLMQRPLSDHVAMDSTDVHMASFEEALLNIPNEQKSGYLKACDKSPRLISIESDPRLFLQFENNQAEAAAKRFTTFWQARERIFGDKAFLPMVSSGLGALGDDELRLLDTDIMMLLPNNRKSNKVLFSFLKPLSGDSSCYQRCCFYHLFLLMQNVSVQHEGFEGMFPCNEYNSEERTTLDLIIELLRAAFPILPSTMHILQPKVIRIPQLSDWQAMLGGCEWRVSSMDTFRRTLDSRDGNFLPDLLPVSIGGKLTEADFRKTRYETAHAERLRLLKPHEGSQNTSIREPRLEKVVGFFPTQEAPQFSGVDASSASGDSTKTSDDIAGWKLKRRRMLNNEASKRKRAKIKQRQADLEREYGREMKRQMILKSENRQLVKLVEEAEKLVKNLVSSPTAPVQDGMVAVTSMPPDSLHQQPNHSPSISQQLVPGPFTLPDPRALSHLPSFTRSRSTSLQLPMGHPISSELGLQGRGTSPPGMAAASPAAQGDESIRTLLLLQQLQQLQQHQQDKNSQGGKFGNATGGRPPWP